MKIKKLIANLLIIAIMMLSISLNVFAESTTSPSSLLTSIVTIVGGDIESEHIDKKANEYEFGIIWSNGTEAQVIQDLGVSNGSEKYVITEGELVNELIFLASGDILLNGQPVMATSESGTYEAVNIYSKNSSNNNMTRNATWFQTLTPLVGVSSDYNILVKDHGMKSIAFSNALSAVTLTVFVTIVTSICAYPYTVGMEALRAHIVGTGAGAVTGGTLAALDSFLSLSKLKTPNEKVANYKVLEYSYSKNSLHTIASEFMTLFYLKNSSEASAMTYKYSTMYI